MAGMSACLVRSFAPYAAGSGKHYKILVLKYQTLKRLFIGDFKVSPKSNVFYLDSSSGQLILKEVFHFLLLKRIPWQMDICN